MFKKEILERLRKGEESTIIANELADALNEAVADYEAEVKAKEEQMRKEAELKAKRSEANDNLTKAIKEYMAAMYPEAKVDVSISTDDAKKVIDSLFATKGWADEFDKVLNSFSKMFF